MPSVSTTVSFGLTRSWNKIFSKTLAKWIAKSDLITYYSKVLNAQAARGQRMYIDEAAANILLDKYIRK